MQGTEVSTAAATATDWPAWLAVGATLLAVFVALFKEELVHLWRSPDLHARLNLEPPDCHQTVLSVFNTITGAEHGQALCYYLRFWVENRGRSEARQVQAVASALRKKHADGSFKPDSRFLPMNLRWSITQSPSGGPLLRAPGISPGMGRHCDLGHITDPEHRKKMRTTPNDPHLGESVVELDLEAAPHTNSHLLPAGSYQLDVMLAADNTKPKKVTFEITFKGQWTKVEQEMFEDQLGIRTL